jgi:hypothetical protein
MDVIEVRVAREIPMASIKMIATKKNGKASVFQMAIFGFHVVKTKFFFTTTGNGSHIPPIKMVMTGGWFMTLF